MSFSALKLHPDLLRALGELGFMRPTPIQTDAIPPVLAGRDIIACAMTGSGKTAAFLLPLVHRLLERPRKTTRVLILTPTRELAAQILGDLNDLAVHTPITGAAVYGGVGPGPQEHAFRSGVDVMIATPGRLLDHLRFPYAKLGGLEYLVLDEADRMLDMGFLPEIHKILALIPPRRQTLFFSATMPPPIVELSRKMLKNPLQISLQTQSSPAVGITQAVYPVGQDSKSSLLLALLQRGEIHEALTFTRTKHRADRLAKFLMRSGIAAERIHGNRSQAQRTQALAGFKAGKYRVLVATDIAARGIDVEELGHVVNFDVPRAPEDYVHRIGRTGRASATGDAFTFVSPAEEGELRRIEAAIGKRLPRITIPDFDYNAKTEKPELPLAERLAAIRQRKARERENALSKRGAHTSAPKSKRPKARPAGPTARPTSGHGTKPHSGSARPAGGGSRPHGSSSGRPSGGSRPYGGSRPSGGKPSRPSR